MESKTMLTQMKLNHTFGLLLILACWWTSGCAQLGSCRTSACSTEGCGAGGCGLRLRGRCLSRGCGANGQLCDRCSFALTGCLWKRSNAIPQTLPLGSTILAHDQVMETNAEAADFIFHRHDFVTQTAHLTPDAKDKIVEIAARMRTTPFPVVIERSENNSNPELDALRRNIIATILTDFGNTDAQQRTVVATPYGRGYTGRQAENMYFQYLGTGNNNNNNNNGGGVNNGGGFGGGF